MCALCLAIVSYFLSSRAQKCLTLWMLITKSWLDVCVCMCVCVCVCVCVWNSVMQRILCLYQHVSRTFYYTKQKHVNFCLDVKKLFSVLVPQNSLPFHNSSLMVHTVRQINSLHMSSLKYHFNIIPHSAPLYFSFSLSFLFSD